MARTSKREMIARKEQIAREMAKALEPKKNTRKTAIQPTTKAAQQHKSLYVLYRIENGARYTLFAEYHYDDNNAIAWAARTLARVKTIYRDMQRAELDIESTTGATHKVQGFYRKD